MKEKPQPQISEAARPYWEGANQGILKLQRCNGCGCVQFYPKPNCSYCLCEDLAWFTASGKGFIYSYTVIWRAPSQAFAADVPYVLALIELEEGVKILANVRDCREKDLAIGKPVTVFFEERGKQKLPQFRFL